MTTSPDVHDTLIIGGGPGGLTAAIYLRRFTRKVAVFDKGNSRLSLIPVSHNYPGFPEGVAGAELLANLREQLERYGGAVTDAEILSLRIEDGTFVGEYDGGEVRALTVLIATGIVDASLPIERWRDAVASGAVRLCPVCDGYDVIDKRIAVISSEKNPIGHAMFMRSFSEDVTLFDRTEGSILDAEERQRLEAAGVRYVRSAVREVTMGDDMKPVLHTGDGKAHEFDVMYPMLGETARSDLAAKLGAETADCGELVVDDFQCTTVPGMYAVGDVVRGLNQISVAAGQAAVAATRIHNTLPWTLRQK
ncbi:NAD(P)/FAD-dependent oxidoreductase [Massilia sp. R2A-15]|uniref:NAD(P)/FAD-dependent oxidoreductase n=1 Tax=Massilia sp. R2A-15 TaxID=3064278 RepID=UPI0027343779|nr:NAD(P)/FAD-dependent oxidoreductase [Massilia sp. R2A-15]WLI91508.1 NAD(P)/FAD-dependent oxidoreductase [Massilia sp. R2A-15]